MESVLNVSYIMLGLILKLSAFWCGLWGQNPLPWQFYLVKVRYIVTFLFDIGHQRAAFILKLKYKVGHLVPKTGALENPNNIFDSSLT